MGRSGRDATRAVLFEAALEQFGTVGFQKTTHADIAAAAGMARTTFYEYFSSTEDLLVQLVVAKMPELVDELMGDLAEDLVPRERLRALTLRMIEFVGTDHLGLILHTEVPRLSEEAQVQISDAHGDLMRSFGSAYVEGSSSGAFRSLPPRLAGHLIYQVIMTAGRTVMDSANPQKQVHEIAEAAAGFLISGLSNS
jgi:AcrR family transcriptional regulator